MATSTHLWQRPAIRNTVTMDAASLSFGLLSAFNVVVEDIRIIRDCQSFGQDYQTTQLKFQLAEARLVRWGVAVGIADRGDPSNQVQDKALEKLVPEEDRKQAERTLQAISIELESAKKKIEGYDVSKDEALEQGRKGSVSRLLGKHRGAGSQGGADQGPQADTLSTLSDDFKEMSLKRHSRTSAAKKTKWALFEKDELSALLTSVRDLVGELEALFPATHQARTSLAAEEATIPRVDAVRELLEQMAKDSDVRDKALLDAVTAASSTRVENNHGSFVFSGGASNHNSGVQSTKDVTFHGSTINFGGGGGGGGR